MIRRLYVDTFALRSQIQLLYHSNQKWCQLNSCRLLGSTVQKIQQVNLCTNLCDKKTNESDCSNATNPIVINLQKQLQCTQSEAITIYKHLISNGDEIKLDTLNRILKFLNRVGATFPIIMKNCQILLIPLDRLKIRFGLLSRRTWDSVDDFVPLLTIPESRIKRIQKYNISVIRDRIYLFKQYCSIETHVISHYCSKHPFVFEIKLELLKRKLDMLLSCNVSSENILRDLDVLARAEDVIQKRLEYLKLCGIEHVMPWMIKCQDHVLHRAIAIRHGFGSEQNRTMEILTKRLHWHRHTASSIFSKNKFLRKLNPETASKLLDELLKILSPSDITANLTILSLSIPHVKIRVAELIALKTSPIPPRLIRMSDNSFKKYLNKSYKK